MTTASRFSCGYSYLGQVTTSYQPVPTFFFLNTGIFLLNYRCLFDCDVTYDLEKGAVHNLAIKKAPSYSSLYYPVTQISAATFACKTVAALNPPGDFLNFGDLKIGHIPMGFFTSISDHPFCELRNCTEKEKKMNISKNVPT